MSYPIELERGLSLLGVLKACKLLPEASTLEFALLRIEAIKAKAKSRFRKLAFKYHPDRTQNNPKLTEKFKEATKAYAYVNELKAYPEDYPSETEPEPEYVESKSATDVVLAPPPIPLGMFSYHMRPYIKRLARLGRMNYCYLFCTAKTCKHGTYRRR